MVYFSADLQPNYARIKLCFLFGQTTSRCLIPMAGHQTIPVIQDVMNPCGWNFQPQGFTPEEGRQKTRLALA